MNHERSDDTAMYPGAPPQFPTHEQRAHTVGFYSKDQVLLDEVSRFIGTALGAGDAAIVIATPAHREGLAQRLTQSGLDISRLATEGRFVALDAAETLSKITLYGFPDRSRFTELIGGQILSAQKRTEHKHPSPYLERWWHCSGGGREHGCITARRTLERGRQDPFVLPPLRVPDRKFLS